MRSSWIRVSSKCNDKFLMREERGRQRRGQGDVKAEAGTEVMRPQVKDHSGWLAATRKLGERSAVGSPSEPLEETDTADILILDFLTTKA